MNVNFTQTIAFECDDPAKVKTIVEMMHEWDRMQATSDIMGYMGSRMLCDRDMPGHYMIVAEFGVVDPDVSAAEEAARNNDRPETNSFADRMRKLVQNEPEWHHYDEIYRTDFV